MLVGVEEEQEALVEQEALPEYKAEELSLLVVGAVRAEHRVVKEEELYKDLEGADKREEMALGIELSLQ